MGLMAKDMLDEHGHCRKLAATTPTNHILLQNKSIQIFLTVPVTDKLFLFKEVLQLKYCIHQHWLCLILLPVRSLRCKSCKHFGMLRNCLENEDGRTSFPPCSFWRWVQQPREECADQPKRRLFYQYQYRCKTFHSEMHKTR